MAECEVRVNGLRMTSNRFVASVENLTQHDSGILECVCAKWIDDGPPIAKGDGSCTWEWMADNRERRMLDFA